MSPQPPRITWRDVGGFLLCSATIVSVLAVAVALPWLPTLLGVQP